MNAPNIMIFRNAYRNDTKAQPHFIGSCKINRIDYNVSLWLTVTDDNVKYLNGGLYIRRTPIVSGEKIGKITIYNGNIIGKMYGYLYFNNEKYKIYLSVKKRKQEKFLIGYAMYHSEIETNVVKKENVADFITKITKENG